MLSNKNEIDLGSYNASYLSHDYQPSNFAVKSFWPENALRPIPISSKQYYDSLKVKLLFKNATIKEFSAMNQHLKQCEISDLGIINLFSKEITFDCTLLKSTIESIVTGMFIGLFEFDALAYGKIYKLDIRSYTTSASIQGSKPTNAVLTFENGTGDTSFNGITVRSMVPGERIVVNGVHKIVSLNGKNAWERVDMINFPQLNPGENQINVVGNAEITLEYKEVW